jgi:Glycosyl transferase family 11
MKIGKFIRILLGVEKRLENMQVRQRILENHVVQLQNLYLADKRDSVLVDPIIVPRLSGGLGNQMFQIAAAYALARRVGSKLALNYDRHFSTGQGGHPLKYKDTLFKKIPVTAQWPTTIYRYHEYRYCPLFPSRHVQLDGYFQSGKYFDDFQDEVRDLFEFPEPAQAEARRYLALDKRPTVGIHMRLGDYFSTRYKSSLGVCTPYYYQTALSHFPKDEYRFILCSDDPEAAKEILNDTSVEIFRGSDELAEMALLSQCNNLIISNSSFSWWSSFMGIKKKKVIAPRIWFSKKSGLMDADMYEDTWTKVPTKKKILFS